MVLPYQLMNIIQNFINYCLYVLKNTKEHKKNQYKHHSFQQFNSYQRFLKQFIYQITLMLIKTQVKRRTQSINQYILSLRQKVYDHRYKQAKLLLTHSRQSINNSYMAPYDPNVYLLDSLKAKNEKLRREKEAVQRQIMVKQDEISKIKVKRGFSKEGSINKSQIGQSYQFIPKIVTDEMGIFVSRLVLQLQDVEKIDYQSATIETDFQIFRVVAEGSIINILFSQIISIQSEGCYIIFSWKPNGSESNNYIILKFWGEEERTFWSRCFNFSKIICESKLKEKLFFKQQQQYNINVTPEIDPKITEDAIVKQIYDKNIALNRFPNLNLGSNKSHAMDRLRRRSQYYPNMPNIGGNMSLINRSKSRKVSQDLTLKDPGNRINGYTYDRKSNNQKSQKSFQDEISVTNSTYEKQKQRQQAKKQLMKPDPKKNEQTNNKLQKLKQERQKLYAQSKLNNNTQSNRQIFFNESSIHWIEQQNQDLHSKSSHSKNAFGKKNFLDALNKQGQTQTQKNQHISEVAAEIEESPLLPYSVIGRNKQAGDKFQVKITQVPMTKSPDKKTKPHDLSSQKSGKSNSSKNVKNMSKSKSNRPSQQQIENDQQQQYLKNNDIESINEQSIGQQEQNHPQIKQTLSIEDKSQDLASQNQNLQTQSTKYNLDDLIYGIMLLKCSPDGWKPHMKKLHLSNNNSQLCWKNQKGDDLKKIDISDIEKILYNSGTITQGIMKHIKMIEKRRCLVIKYRLKNKTKLLEFYLPDGKKVEDLQVFYQKLDRYVRYKNNELS